MPNRREGCAAERTARLVGAPRNNKNALKHGFYSTPDAPPTTITQLARRLGTDYNNLRSILLRAEAQGLLLSESPHRPTRIYLFRDLTEINRIAPE